jgi:UDP-galactopyranose mutase
MRFTWNNNYFNDKYQGIPEEGYTKWIENMIFRDAPSKVNLLLGVDYLGKRIELNAMAGHVFYSGRPDLLYGQHDLPFRGLKFETSVMPIPDFQGTAVVNHNTKDVPYTRTIEHKHFQPWKEGTEMCVPRSMTTVVTTETPCLCNKADDEPYYPINSQENERIYRGYADVAKDSRIHLCGRLGLYRYLDMDDCIESALNMADEWCAKM